MKISEIKHRISEHVDSILKDTLSEDDYDLWRDAQFDPVAAAKLRGDKNAGPHDFDRRNNRRSYGPARGELGYRGSSAKYDDYSPRKSYPKKAAPAAAAGSSDGKQYLTVPYAAREAAKAAGARWDAAAKKWYMTKAGYSNPQYPNWTA